MPPWLFRCRGILRKTELINKEGIILQCDSDIYWITGQDWEYMSSLVQWIEARRFTLFFSMASCLASPVVKYSQYEEVSRERSLICYMFATFCSVLIRQRILSMEELYKILKIITWRSQQNNIDMFVGLYPLLHNSFPCHILYYISYVSLAVIYKRSFVMDVQVSCDRVVSECTSHVEIQRLYILYMHV